MREARSSSKYRTWEIGKRVAFRFSTLAPSDAATCHSKSLNIQNEKDRAKNASEQKHLLDASSGLAKWYSIPGDDETLPKSRAKKGPWAQPDLNSFRDIFFFAQKWFLAWVIKADPADWYLSNCVPLSRNSNIQSCHVPLPRSIFYTTCVRISPKKSC